MQKIIRKTFATSNCSYYRGNFEESLPIFDDRRKMQPHQLPGSSSYHVKDDILSSSLDSKSTFAPAFFTKTPPPPYNRQPNCYRRHLRSNTSPHHHIQLPTTLTKNMLGLQDALPYPYKLSRKHTYTSCLHRVNNIGTTAHMFLETIENDPNDTTDELVAYLDAEIPSSNDRQGPHGAEFQEWICAFFDMIDKNPSLTNSVTRFSTPSSTFNLDSTAVSTFSLQSVAADLHEMDIQFAQNVFNHMLIEPWAPRNLSFTDWLDNVGWRPFLVVRLPETTKPFLLGGVTIAALRVACLFCQLNDNSGKSHPLRFVVFALPHTTIPFPLGLLTQRQNYFEIYPREDPRSSYPKKYTNGDQPTLS